MSADRKLLDELATELMLLRSAWIIAADDDRRRKVLSVSPSDVRRWSRLIQRAGRASGGGA